ncbi:amidohydrolase family protein [Pusillimonas sp. CC-YST705]|uniref:Amidohydrolase family protein n=1 Tax=Mesopusillimonas faecipullorum TaxID=2755040 RepID=A0ABS8CEF4_9BURK|nr:amidohydrolase family protein [Mesopusillimonas faecipullorum]
MLVPGFIDTHALCLDDHIGTLQAGKEADIAVIDLHSTPLIDARMKHCDSVEEALFIQMSMADDRAIKAVYVNGRLAHERDAAPTAPVD